MQEEVTQKTIALVFKSSRLTADVLKKAMKMYLQHRKAGKQATHGKMSVKKLVGQGMGASSIEVTDNNIKSFERVARKYNVDFAVKKDKTVEPPKYMVFFKGKDADVITQAFKEFVKVNEKKRGRVSVKVISYKGKNILNVHPPPKVFDNSIFPLCISTNSFAIHNPKP